MFNFVIKILKWVIRQPSLSIRIMGNSYFGNSNTLQLEVENHRDITTSLKPKIKSTFWFPHDNKYIKGQTEYYIQETNRNLAPFSPCRFSAVANNLPNSYQYSWFLTYRVSPTRGFDTIVYVRNVLQERLNIFRFTFEVVLFQIFGKVKKHRSMSIDDYRKIQKG